MTSAACALASLAVANAACEDLTQMGMTEIEKRALKGGAALDVTGRPPDVTGLPVRVPRDRAAELVSERYFKISRRSLERAPLQWQILNGKAHVETAALFAWAETVVAAAPLMRSGHCPQQAA